MKRKYYFHRHNTPLEPDHVIYIVWIGESVREQKMLTKMVAWAFAHGATLMSWSEDIDYYLQYEEDRCFPGRGLLSFGFRRDHIKAADLLTLMEDNSFDAYERALTVPKSYFSMLRYIQPSAIDTKASKIKIDPVPTSPRKHLSESSCARPAIIKFN